MGKQHRRKGAETEPVRVVSEQPELDPSLLQQGSLGNQALQAQMAGEDGPVAASLDVVRDVALPKLDRATLALQFLPRPHEQVSRFVEILQRSALEGDRRQALVDKLLTDQAAAEGVSESIQRWLGSDQDAWRSQLLELLELTGEALQQGQAHEGGWELPTGEVVALAEEAEASTADRAVALVGEVAASLASPEIQQRLGDVSAAVRGYVSTVVLAILLDEEEEEEEEAAWPEVEEA